MGLVNWPSRFRVMASSSSSSVPGAAGQGHQAVDALEELRLPLVHRLGQLDVREALVGPFHLVHELGHDALDPAAAGEDGVGELAHEPLGSAAADDVDVLFEELPGQPFRGLEIRLVDGGARGAIDADFHGTSP